MRSLLRTLSLTFALIIALAPARAHDIADEIAVTGFVRPSADATDVLLRVPLAVLGELDLPQSPAGFLDLTRAGPALRLAAGTVARAFALHDAARPDNQIRLDHRIAGLRVTPPGDRSFQAIGEALALIRGPALPAEASLPLSQGFLDLHLVYPRVTDPVLHINLAPAQAARLHLGLRMVLPDGTMRAYEVKGARAEIRLDPRWQQAAMTFLTDGVRHIIGGVDHLLFLICLIIPFRRQFWRLIGVVTAFTIGHSVTLALAALGLVAVGPWFAPLVETLIAASILYMALENVLWGRFERRWLFAAAFGLIHGFGFANALGETLQFAGAHLVLSLLVFNLGIEAGQIAVLLIVVPLLNLIFRIEVLRRYGVLLISIFVGHEAWHWMIERGGQIKLAELQAIDWAGAAPSLAWLAAAIASLALAALVASRLRVPRLPGSIGRQRS